MLNRILLFFFLCVLFSCNTNCLTKDSFISSYDDFVETALNDNPTETSFIALEKNYEAFTSDCYEKFREEMTNVEKVHFWKQTLKYQSLRHDSGEIEDLFSPELQILLEKDLETFTKEGKEELVKIFREEVAPELNQAIDEVVKGIEEIGESLKEWLNTAEGR